VVIAMSSSLITTDICAVKDAISDQRLIERATIDHVEALLDLIRPMSAPDAIRLVTELTRAIETRGQP
jgi:hypothetical protein